MYARLAVPSLAFTTAIAILACQSSGRYGTATNAAIGTGIGVAGAVVSRATGGCYAQCLPGTMCNTKTGLCERVHVGGAGQSANAGSSGRPMLSANASYPPGYESEIPPLADAGCDPASSDAGALMCEMDASAPH